MYELVKMQLEIYFVICVLVGSSLGDFYQQREYGYPQIRPNINLLPKFPELNLSSTQSKYKPCKEGSLKMKGCNACTCTNGEWTCTRMHWCDTPATRDKFIPRLASMTSGESENEQCEEGSLKMKDCNTCRCMNGGWTCTRKMCYTPVPAPIPTPAIRKGYMPPAIDIRKGYVPSINYKECEEGSIKMKDCNGCRCINGGWFCSRKMCYTAVPSGRPAIDIRKAHMPPMPYEDYMRQSFQLPSKRESEQLDSDHVSKVTRKQYCTPGQAFKQQCNTCVCSPDGTHASCTRMACFNDEY